MDFQNFQKSNFEGFDHPKTFPGVTRNPQKNLGPIVSAVFDVYWIQTNRQTDKQTDMPNLYIDYYMHFLVQS